MDIQAKTRATILEHGLLERGDRVLLACSGGADSTCMLHLLRMLASEWSLDLAVAHFNHRLRRDADEDERFVRSLAESSGLPFYTGSQDVSLFAREEGLNLEEAGRVLRYAFLDKTAEAIGAGKVATAHTVDDQAETVLMRLLRGSGRSGLAGIPYKREQRIIRPLLNVARSEVEAYLTSHALTYRSDLSNQDRRYLRNRVRLELLPFLQEHFAEEIVSRLGRLAEVFQAEETWLGSVVESAAAEAIVLDRGVPSLDLSAISEFPIGLQRRLVRRFLLRLRGDLRHISFEDIETLRALAEGREFTLEKGLVLRRRKGRVEVRPDPRPRLDYRYSWDLDSPLRIPELGISLSGEILPPCIQPGSLAVDDMREARMDADRLTLPLTVRSRRPGDRFRPLGTSGRAKLKEVFRSREIAPEDRDRHPVCESGETIAWVLGLPVSEEFKITDKTARILHLRVERED